MTLLWRRLHLHDWVLTPVRKLPIHRLALGFQGRLELTGPYLSRL